MGLKIVLKLKQQNKEYSKKSVVIMMIRILMNFKLTTVINKVESTKI